MIDSITLALFLGIWPIFLAWELVVLYLRATAPMGPKTISMVARDIGWKLTSLTYGWAGYAAHWWWPAAHSATTVGGVAFWVVQSGLLLWDLILQQRKLPTKAWYRNPLIWLSAGVLGGHFLFPQTAT